MISLVMWFLGIALGSIIIASIVTIIFFSAKIKYLKLKTKKEFDEGKIIKSKSK